MSATIKPRCELCRDTGSLTTDGYLDCVACDTAAIMVALNDWLARHPKATPAEIFQHGRAVERIAANSLPHIREGSAAPVAVFEGFADDGASTTPAFRILDRPALRAGMKLFAGPAAAPVAPAELRTLLDEAAKAMDSTADLDEQNDMDPFGIEYARDLAKRLRAAGAAPVEAASPWISVKDRLPEFDFKAHRVSMFIDVIATLIDGSVCAMHYRANGWTAETAKPSWQFADGRSCLGHLVTHWMPLPAAPAPGESQ